jgi:superfamily II DNA or RNA helicase
MHEAVRTYEHRDVQSDCLNAIKQARLEGHTRGLINMAPGLGKTYIAARDAQEYLRDDPNSRILYLCHNTDILRQARRTFEEVLGTDIGHGSVFEGQSNDQQQVVYASFQTLNGRDSLYQALDPAEFDYVIDDESHHAAARTHKEVLSYLRPKFLLGLSATPERHDGRDILDVFGSEIYRKTLEEALAEGLLTPVNYKVFTDHLQQIDDFAEMVERIGMGELNRTLFIPRRDEEIAEILFDELSKIKNPHGLVYAQSIEHAERMAGLLPEAVAIHSKLRPGHERELKNAFYFSEIPIAVVVDKYNEGIDVPTINFLAPLRSTTSFRIWRQQLGRGLRVYEGKDEVRVADLAPSFERIQMVLDLEAGVRRAIKGEVSEIEPREISIGVNFDFSEEARDAIELIKKARSSYENSRDRYRRPIEGVTAMSIPYETADGEAKELQLDPEEVLVLKSLWSTADGRISTRDLRQLYEQQFKTKILQKDLDQKLSELVDRKILANVAFLKGEKSSRLWRLSDEMVHLLSATELFKAEYDQALLNLHQTLANRVDAAIDKGGVMPSFIDLLKSWDDPNDQMRVFFDADEPYHDKKTVELRGNLGYFGKFEKSDVTGPELAHLLNLDNPKGMSVPVVRALVQANTNTFIHIRQGEVTSHAQVSGTQRFTEYGEAPYLQFFDRKLTPGEINNITGILEEYSVIMYTYTSPLSERDQSERREIYRMLSQLDKVREDPSKDTWLENPAEPAESIRVDYRTADEYEARLIAGRYEDYPDLLDRFRKNPRLIETAKDFLNRASWYSEERKNNLRTKLDEILNSLNTKGDT